MKQEADRPELRLVRVEAPHFVAGILVCEERRLVVQAAPILNWTLGLSWDDAWKRLRRRGWAVSAYERRS